MEKSLIGKKIRWKMQMADTFENKKDKMSDKTGKQIVNKNSSIDIENKKHFRQIIQKRNSGLERTEKKVYSCISLQQIGRAHV